MSWIYLLAAGVLEIAWALAMKQSEGFAKPGPTLFMVVAMIGSFILLSLAMRSLPLGTAYTIWTGIGAIGAFVIGALYLGEMVTLPRVVALVLIVSGLTLMKLSVAAS